MSSTLAVVGTPLENIKSFAPFDVVKVWSGQVTSDASGGAVLFDFSLLVSGVAKHLYLLQAEISSDDTALEGDRWNIQRSVSPEWTTSPRITTGRSIVQLPLMGKETNASSHALVSDLPIVPMYLGQVQSAGTSLLRARVSTNTNGQIHSCSFLVGEATEFIHAPPNTWPLYS
jgi:hypothetical protein